MVAIKVITKVQLVSEVEHILFIYFLLELCILVVLPVQKYYFYSNKKTKCFFLPINPLWQAFINKNTF